MKEWVKMPSLNSTYMPCKIFVPQTHFKIFYMANILLGKPFTPLGPMLKTINKHYLRSIIRHLSGMKIFWDKPFRQILLFLS